MYAVVQLGQITAAELGPAAAWMLSSCCSKNKGARSCCSIEEERRPCCGNDGGAAPRRILQRPSPIIFWGGFNCAGSGATNSVPTLQKTAYVQSPKFANAKSHAVMLFRPFGGELDEVRKDSVRILK